MAVSNHGAGRFGVFVFLTCVAISAGGVWYMQGGRFWEDEQEAEDEEEEGYGERVDAGAKRRGSKKTAPRAKKKATEGRQARTTPPREPTAPAIPMPTGPSGPSYESAIAGNNLNLAPGTQDVPDLTDAQLGAPLREGTFLDACGVPASTKVTVKVAIKNGHAVGVSVYTTPTSREQGWCVEKHVRGLQWPSNAKMDSFVTHY